MNRIERIAVKSEGRRVQYVWYWNGEGVGWGEMLQTLQLRARYVWCWGGVGVGGAEQFQMLLLESFLPRRKIGNIM